MIATGTSARVRGTDVVGTVHAYPPGSAMWAALRAAAGIASVATLWGLLGASAPVTLGAAVLALPFAIYGFRAVGRARAQLRLCGSRLEVDAPGGRQIDLGGLTALRLAYYSTRRDGENGWMELRLRDPDGALVVESEIDGFADIAAASLAGARRAGLTLSSATERNFARLLEIPSPALRRMGEGR